MRLFANHSLAHRLVGATLSLLLLGTALSAGADALDDEIAAHMQRQQIPGLSIAVVKDGRIVREGGYGYANLEHQVPAGVQTVFQSGSIGKQFTAALVLMLVRDGKLALDAPVSRYLAGLPRAWKPITIRHLLTHTSGIADADDAFKLSEQYDDQRLLRTGTALPVKARPGVRWEYNNFAYQLLGVLCTRVGGKHYGEQLRERIFAPAGMSARIISERDLVPHRAAGYDVVDGAWKNQEWVSPTLNTTADGSLYLTARDLAAWSIALDGDAILTAQEKAAMWTPVRLADGKTHPYGFGWFLSPTLGRQSVWHDGEWQGFVSQITRFPSEGLCVIVLVNRSGADPAALAELLAKHFL